MAVDTEKDTQEQRERQKKKGLPVSKREDVAEKGLRSNTSNKGITQKMNWNLY